MKYFPVLLISLLIFSCSNPKEEKFLKKEILEVAQSADQINNKFSIIKSECDNFLKVLQEAYEHSSSFIPKVDKSRYKYTDQGVYYKSKDDGGSAIFVSALSKDSEKAREVVYLTEAIDSYLIAVTKKFPEVAQAYYNSKEQLTRIYPFFDVVPQFQTFSNLNEHSFYYLAMERNNPSRQSLWVNELYVDPAGRGWMISVVAPFYFKNEFKGVPGLDITIKDITQKMIKGEDYLLLDHRGVIISAHRKILDMLKFPPLDNNEYSKAIQMDTFRKDAYNIHNNKSNEIRELGENIYDEKVHHFNHIVNGNEYTFICNKIDQLNWRLVKILKPQI